jgi:hypothetical protein
MTFIKINNVLYPVIEINGYITDHEWNGRSSKSITLNMTNEQAKALFVDDIDWSIVSQDITQKLEPNNEIGGYNIVNEVLNEHEYNNSEYSVAGDIIDHRNGTVTVKMGTPTEGELLNMLLEGLDL